MIYTTITMTHVGIIISSIAIIVSILLFNASVNTQRKIELVKIKSLLFEVLSVFRPDFNVYDFNEKVQIIDELVNPSMIEISEHLNLIKACFKSVPMLNIHEESLKKGNSLEYKYTIDLKEYYKKLIDYFSKSKINNLGLIVEYYNPSNLFSLNYSEKIIYRRFLLINPITGYTIVYIRNSTHMDPNRFNVNLKLKKRISKYKHLEKYFSNIVKKISNCDSSHKKYGIDRISNPEIITEKNNRKTVLKFHL